ncbi:gamma-glutamylcyclotransferase family protein [Roseibacillus persicicus]|uniref:gamma-glutamylcyclotransferase family protein n=1 Tax=Roseibacillus persicicus TaxID=454148 RepID=UPI00280E9D76|nr:gamma-glutamylcyclotransferase family protein [Roseibacillus persicicus]MDQ8189911.1 gamma-glutamylcyclotransferase [Roseibacillus persicicus]
MKVPVFVYGALRQGASNAWRMERASFVGKATVAGTLVKVDWYPGLVLGGDALVQGEVYQVDEQTLRELDEFEGIGVEDTRNDEYRRVEATVRLDDGTLLSCQIYEWQLGVEAYEVVANGDWLTVAASR